MCGGAEERGLVCALVKMGLQMHLGPKLPCEQRQQHCRGPSDSAGLGVFRLQPSAHSVPSSLPGVGAESPPPNRGKHEGVEVSRSFLMVHTKWGTEGDLSLVVTSINAVWLYLFNTLACEERPSFHCPYPPEKEVTEPRLPGAFVHTLPPGVAGRGQRQTHRVTAPDTARLPFSSSPANLLVCLTSLWQEPPLALVKMFLQVTNPWVQVSLPDMAETAPAVPCPQVPSAPPSVLAEHSRGTQTLPTGASSTPCSSHIHTPGWQGARLLPCSPGPLCCPSGAHTTNRPRGRSWCEPRLKGSDQGPGRSTSSH